jgi:hypothetical protein
VSAAAEKAKRAAAESERLLTEAFGPWRPYDGGTRGWFVAGTPHDDPHDPLKLRESVWVLEDGEEYCAAHRRFVDDPSDDDTNLEMGFGKTVDLLCAHRNALPILIQQAQFHASRITPGYIMPPERRYPNPIERGKIGGKAPPAGTRVHAYRNLNVHNEVGWSLRDAKSGLVVAIVPEVILENATLRVSEAGRQRVLKEKRKSVHAWGDGAWAPRGPGPGARWERIRYNPYVFSTFVRAKDESPVLHARWLRLNEDGAYAVLDAAAPSRRKNPIHDEVAGEIDLWNGV